MDKQVNVCWQFPEENELMCLCYKLILGINPLSQYFRKKS